MLKKKVPISLLRLLELCLLFLKRLPSWLRCFVVFSTLIFNYYLLTYVFQAEEYVPLPKGDVHKKKELVQDVTLHDLDVANARPQVSHYFLSYCNYYIIAQCYPIIVKISQ